MIDNLNDAMVMLLNRARVGKYAATKRKRKLLRKPFADNTPWVQVEEDITMVPRNQLEVERQIERSRLISAKIAEIRSNFKSYVQLKTKEFMRELDKNNSGR